MDDAVPICARAAIEINSIFTMYDRYYPLSRASYIVIFAGFLQATVDLALADREKSVSGATLSRLALAGRVLSGGSANIPGMHSSVRCLQEHLHATLSRCNSWVPSSKSRQGSEHSASGVRAKIQNISPSPPIHSSASPPDSQPDRSSKDTTSISMSPVSMLPSTHGSEDAELTPLSPHYPMLPQAHASGSVDITSMHLSPSEPTTTYTIPLSGPDYHLSESAYGAQVPYTPQTPDHEVIDYMTGSQLSHYEGGWNAWFWPGEGSGSTFGPGASGNMVQNPHIAAM